jgi:hypothetical protein
MAESLHGLYKWELIHARGPWHRLADVECATLEHVDWFNHLRLHGDSTDGPASPHPVRELEVPPTGLHAVPRNLPTHSTERATGSSPAPIAPVSLRP